MAATPKPKPLSDLEKSQLNAQRMLDAERKAWAKKHGGVWPSDSQLSKSRKSMK